MATKKSPAKAAGIAADLTAAAVQLFENEVVREQLRRVPKAVVDWAVEFRHRAKDKGWPTSLTKLNPADRFGQRGLERRVEKLSQALALAFGDQPNRPPELTVAVAELKRAIDVAGTLPITKRKPLQMRIDNELDALEKSLADAVLPKD